MLKQFNFWISSFLPQKLYWYLAGLINPWQAVLEDAPTKEAVYRRNQDIVNILEKLKLINKQSVVLDIGCGVGRAEVGLVKKVKEIIGIDISPSMINLAKKYIQDQNIKFFTTNGRDLKEFNNNTFDVVFCILVFQHLPRKIFYDYLKEAYRVLKTRGKLFFQIPIYFNQKPKDPPLNHPWALRFYSLNELESILRTTGFKKIKFFNVGGNRLKTLDTQALVLIEK